MPRTKRETKSGAYRCVTGFSYPASLMIRNRIRAAQDAAKVPGECEHLRKAAIAIAGQEDKRIECIDCGEVMESRGESMRYAIGDRIANPPSDLIESWLRRGCVEPIGAQPKSEEAPDDD